MPESISLSENPSCRLHYDGDTQGEWLLPLAGEAFQMLPEQMRTTILAFWTNVPEGKAFASPPRLVVTGDDWNGLAFVDPQSPRQILLNAAALQDLCQELGPQFVRTNLAHELTHVWQVATHQWPDADKDTVEAIVDRLLAEWGLPSVQLRRWIDTRWPGDNGPGSSR